MPHGLTLIKTTRGQLNPANERDEHVRLGRAPRLLLGYILRAQRTTPQILWQGRFPLGSVMLQTPIASSREMD